MIPKWSNSSHLKNKCDPTKCRNDPNNLFSGGGERERTSTEMNDFLCNRKACQMLLTQRSVKIHWCVRWESTKLLHWSKQSLEGKGMGWIFTSRSKHVTYSKTKNDSQGFRCLRGGHKKVDYPVLTAKVGLPYQNFPEDLCLSRNLCKFATKCFFFTKWPILPKLWMIFLAVLKSRLLPTNNIDPYDKVDAPPSCVCAAAREGEVGLNPSGSYEKHRTSTSEGAVLRRTPDYEIWFSTRITKFDMQ